MASRTKYSSTRSTPQVYDSRAVARVVAPISQPTADVRIHPRARMPCSMSDLSRVGPGLGPSRAFSEMVTSHSRVSTSPYGSRFTDGQGISFAESRSTFHGIAGASKPGQV